MNSYSVSVNSVLVLNTVNEVKKILQLPSKNLWAFGAIQGWMLAAAGERKSLQERTYKLFGQSFQH